KLLRLRGGGVHRRDKDPAPGLRPDLEPARGGRRCPGGRRRPDQPGDPGHPSGLSRREASVAAKPGFLVVDDHPGVMTAIEGDLRPRVEERHQLVAARSGAAALELLRAAQQRGDAVALVLADHRMPRISGRELLGEVRRLAPTAKRVLLVLPEDAETGLQAINAGQADDYLLKPWEQPEQRAFPLLDDLLDAWHADARAAFDGIRVV